MTTDEIIHLMIKYIVSPPSPFDLWLAVVRIIFLIASFFLLIFILYFISKTSWLAFRFYENFIEFFTYKSLGAKKILQEWEKTKRRLKNEIEPENKLAIIEADSIFNSILERMGFVDDDFETKISHFVSDYPLSNFDQILEAHKIRNNIINDPDYRLSLDEARKTILTYEKALIDLQVL